MRTCVRSLGSAWGQPEDIHRLSPPSSLILTLLSPQQSGQLPLVFSLVLAPRAQGGRRQPGSAGPFPEPRRAAGAPACGRTAPRQDRDPCSPQKRARLLPPVLNGFLVHSFTFTKTKTHLLSKSRAEEARRSRSRGGTGTGLQPGPTTHV